MFHIPGKECVVTDNWGEDREPQFDCVSGPVMRILRSGWRRAAFRGLMELKYTADRQPVKPRATTLPSSMSNISVPEDTNTQIKTKNKNKTDKGDKRLHHTVNCFKFLITLVQLGHIKYTLTLTLYSQQL